MSLERLRYWLDRLENLTWTEAIKLAVPLTIIIFAAMLIFSNGDNGAEQRQAAATPPARAEPATSRPAPVEAPSQDQPEQPEPEYTHTIETRLVLTEMTIECVETENGWRLSMLGYEVDRDWTLLDLEGAMWEIGIDQDDEYEDWQSAEAIEAATFIGDCALLIRDGEQDWFKINRD